MGVQRSGAANGNSMTGGGLDELNDALDTRLADADARLLERYPGESGRRQPVHTVYIPADRIRAGITREWGEQAIRSLERFAPDAPALAAATGLDEAAVADCLPRVHDKLRAEPVEDLRIDLEDGYGDRPDGEEDEHLRAAARAFAPTSPRGRRRRTSASG